MPEISNSEYQTLLKAQAEAEQLAEKVVRLEKDAENTKIALKAWREEKAELKKQLTEKEGEITSLQEAADESTEKYKEFDVLKEKADKFDKGEAEKAEARTKGIEEMKAKLWEDFMKDNEDFLDGLSEDKVETFLTKSVETLDKKDWDYTPAWGDKGMGDKGGTQGTTEFDKSIQSGDVNGALSAIPGPGQS